MYLRNVTSMLNKLKSILQTIFIKFKFCLMFVLQHLHLLVLLLILHSTLYKCNVLGGRKNIFNKSEIFASALLLFLCANEMVQYNLLNLMKGELLLYQN